MYIGIISKLLIVITKIKSTNVYGFFTLLFLASTKHWLHAVFNGIPTVSTGNRNTIIGNNTLRFLTTGFDNTVLGFQAENNTTTGDNNIFIGSNANASQPDLQNAIAIGANAYQN